MITFIIHRVLVKQILLKPLEYINNKVTKITVQNFRHLASVIYHISNGAIKKYLETDLLNNDETLKNSIYSLKEMTNLVNNEWADDMQVILSDLIDQIHSLLKKTIN